MSVQSSHSAVVPVIRSDIKDGGSDPLRDVHPRVKTAGCPGAHSGCTAQSAQAGSAPSSSAELRDQRLHTVAAGESPITRTQPHSPGSPVYRLFFRHAFTNLSAAPYQRAIRRVGARLLGRWRGLSAVLVWPIRWSPALYIYTSPSLGRMSASAASRSLTHGSADRTTWRTPGLQIRVTSWCSGIPHARD